LTQSVLRIGNEPVQKPGRSKQDYETPPDLIAAIEARWGKLTVDLAARADNAKCPRFITPEQDSLVQDWAAWIGDGIGWLNPEFADISEWAAKCAGCIGIRAIMLTPASIGSEWFADHCELTAKVVGLRPRICFGGCHQLYPAKHPKAGQRNCDESCFGCATYPKDCMLTLWGFGPPTFESWRWK
jgi:site-specific DNA-methyltransferase (adenine-specific)